jgi:hypothetical protein
MQIQIRLLIGTVLAVGLYLPAALGQQTGTGPGTVSVRPRVTASQPGVPSVQVKVDRHRVPLGEEVTFTLAPASGVWDSRFAVTFYFGDDSTPERHQVPDVFRHKYGAAKTYTYSIDVKPIVSSTSTRSPTRPLPTVKLIANPITVLTNSPVSFVAQLSRNYPNIQYRFVFADGAQTDWQDAPQASHSYANAKTYLAYVDIGEGNRGSAKRIGGSPRQPIKVTVGPNPRPSPSPRPSPKPSPRPSAKPSPRPSPSPSPKPSPRPSPKPSPSPSPKPSPSLSPGPSPTPSGSPLPSPSASPTPSPSPSPSPSASVSGNGSPTATATPSPTPGVSGLLGVPDDWWKYLLLALPLIFVAYKTAMFFLLPRPQLVPNLDPGSSRVAPGKPLSIDLQLELDPDVTGGEYGLQTEKGSLIKSERGSDG